MTRFPLAPLVREAGGWMPLAHALGFDSYHELEKRTNVYRWRQEGLTWQTADRLACAINLHPSWIWGDAWFDDAAPAHGMLNGRVPRYRAGCRCERCCEANRVYRSRLPGQAAAVRRRRESRRAA